MNRAVHPSPPHKHLGGGVTMRRTRKAEEVLQLMNGGLNIVKTIQSGNTVVYFADNSYARKTAEQIKEAVDNHWRVGWQIALKMRERGIDV